MSMRFVAAASVALAVFAAKCAEIRTVKGASAANTSIMNTSTWGIDAFSAEDDYFITSNGVCIIASDMDAAGTVEFPGKSLHVQASFQPSINADFTFSVPRDGLFLDSSGSLRSWVANASRTTTITGTSITVTSPRNKAAKLLGTCTAAYRSTYDFRAPLIGASDAVLYMALYKSAYPGKTTLRLLGDCSGFHGTIHANGNEGEIVLGTENFAGTVQMAGDTLLTALDGVDASLACITGATASATIAIPAAETFTVGDLVLSGGLMTFAPVGSGTNTHAAVLVVTNRLAVSSAVTIRYPAAAAAFRAAPLDDLAAAVTVMTLPEGKGTLAADKFVLEMEASPVECGTLPHNPYLAVRTVDGLQRLVVAYDEPVVLLTSTDTSGNGGSSLKEANKWRWSDGELPSSGKHYFIPSGIQFMTLDGTPFAGESLTVRGSLAICNALFSVENLSLLGGCKVFSYSRAVVEGPVATFGDSVILMRPGSGNSMTFNGEVSGAAPFRFCYTEANEVGNDTFVRFTATNLSYVGKVDFTSQSASSEDWANHRTRLRLQVSDPRELGGPMEAYTFDAFKFTSKLGIEALNSLDFTDQTRGIFVDGQGRADVPENARMSFRQPLVWRGRLRKFGAGTLAIGGPSAPRFYYQSAIRDQPLASGDCLTRIVVCEGGLTALTTNALDGCELEIQPGASLLLDTEAADADLRTYGFVNAKWPTPFVLPDGMTTVPVTFEFTGEEPSFAKCTLGICSVGPDATGVSKELFAPEPPEHYCAKVVESYDESTGLTVYSVILARSGLTVIIR